LSKFVRRVGFFFLLLCLSAGALALTHSIWLRWLGEALTYSEPPCKADIVVVLAGDFFGLRIEKAAELVKEGWAPEVLMSGAGTFYGLNEGDLAIQLVVRDGYPAGEFVNLPSPARSTVEEAQYIVRELHRRGVRRFILVTSDFHTRRAAKVYREAAPDIPFCTVASSDHDFNPDSWWHTREGRKVAFIEWLKTFANFFGI
jgi:uncharacterized SAM-binding protein YcdF (DUF218 family)